MKVRLTEAVRGRMLSEFQGKIPVPAPGCDRKPDVLTENDIADRMVRRLNMPSRSRTARLPGAANGSNRN
jgi:hypothetical protein